MISFIICTPTENEGISLVSDWLDFTYFEPIRQSVITKIISWGSIVLCWWDVPLYVDYNIMQVIIKGTDRISIGIFTICKLWIWDFHNSNLQYAVSINWLIMYGIFVIDPENVSSWVKCNKMLLCESEVGTNFAMTKR